MHNISYEAKYARGRDKELIELRKTLMLLHGQGEDLALKRWRLRAFYCCFIVGGVHTASSCVGNRSEDVVASRRPDGVINAKLQAN